MSAHCLDSRVAEMACCSVGLRRCVRQMRFAGCLRGKYSVLKPTSSSASAFLFLFGGVGSLNSSSECAECAVSAALVCSSIIQSVFSSALGSPYWYPQPLLLDGV